MGYLVTFLFVVMILAAVAIVELPRQQHQSGSAPSSSIVIQRTWTYPANGIA